MFGNLLNRAKKVENKDIMEAIVAGCLLVAAADGSASSEEIQKMERILNANDLLESFRGNEIGKVVQRFSNILDADFGVGQKKMLDQIEDIANNPDHAEEVMLAMLAVAKSDGEVSDAEKAALVKVGSALKIRLSDYGLA
jgi:tellurite resistance protein TerB